MKKKKVLTQKDFKLLLSFLNDNNPGTLDLVKIQLEEALKTHPRYDSVVKSVGDPRIRRLAEDFFEELRYKKLEPEFEKLFKKGPKLDLEYGAYLLSKVESPELKIQSLSKPLDKLAEEVNKLISTTEPHPTRAISAMRHCLFDIKKFRGNEENYYDLDNSFVEKVIRSKKGIPISLSCVYMFVAWRLRLLVHGVGLPGHFVVGHRVPRGVVYIDPFRGGKILRGKDCEVLVRRLGIPFKQSYLDPTPNNQILSRMIVNLINIYTDQGASVRAKWLARLFQLGQ